MRTATRRYQGREIQSTIQAPTLMQLNRMIAGLRAYARAHNLGPVKVLSRGRDPDGGYKAVVTAHNFNPFKWVSEKWERRGGGYGARLATARERDQRKAEKHALQMAKMKRKEQELLAKAKVARARASHSRAKRRRKRAGFKLGLFGV